MLRKLGVGILALGLVLAGTAGSIPATAQSSPDAWTSYALNMRTGPGANYDIVTQLPAGVGLIFEGRNEDMSWLLGHTEDGVYRGWVASLYLRYQEGFSATRLAVSSEIVTGGGGVPVQQAPAAEEAAPAAEVPLPAGVTAVTTYDLNVRTGPGTSYSAVTQLPAGTGIVLEARNGDSSWVLGHTQDGVTRGWLASLYLKFIDIRAANLPYSSEIVAGAGPASPLPNINYDGIIMGGYDPARIEGIDLTDYPIIARPTARARDIFLEGRALGNDPHVLAKVGDCSTEHWYFLRAFGWGQYNLGSYTNLQGVVNQFYDSLGYDSEASHNGFNANTVMAPEYANPAVCLPGESPLLCEYRIHKPSIAVIMFGTSDLLVMTPYEFDFYMRIIVNETIEAGIIPVLSTFPSNLSDMNRTSLYNKIVVRIALDYDIPLINLWLALEALPNHGDEADGVHLGEPAGDPADFSNPQNMQTGYPVRNLVTLQSLDAIWRGVMQ